MSTQKTNLDFWNSVCETDQNYTKEAGYGRMKFTAIDAQYQLKTATEKWGMYGSKWGVKDISYELISNGQGHPYMQAINGTFWYPDGEFPISSDILFFEGEKLKVVKDQRKKLLTDITTKALSKLGFNADVFLGKFDDSKYVNELKKETDLNGEVFNKAALKKYKPTIVKYLSDHDTPEQIIEKIESKYKRIEPKTKAIMKTLTVENVDQKIRQL